MNAERWRRIEQLFHEASLRPPEHLGPWLAGVCAGDTELEREVLRLIESDRQPETGVRRVIAEASHDLLTDGIGVSALSGTRVGAWRVDHLLGEGGMGIVFLAHRDDGRFEQLAAIKLLRLAIATPADLQRFRRERRILARLTHPHIARLLDAGEHTLGTGLEVPYFVMEHVEGTALTDYAKSRGLTTRQRLELFLQVLDAVGHAHQRFVLHRDLKPANILVTASGEVKLLDFGISQMLEGDPTGPPDRTRSSLMTPDYASPEQLRGDPLTVQSDVFTLGALLYELLSGRRAYATIVSASPLDRALAMAETPLAPLGIDTDLDTVVARAAHPDITRRYPSVEAFAADISRYLAGQPVSVRRDSRWYRAGKFASRHRWPLTAAAVVILSLAGGVIATASEARRANRHLAELRQLSGRHLFQVHDALESLQGATKARELLAATSAQYLDGLSAAAGDDPAFLRDLGSAYQRLARIFGGPNGAHLGRVDDGIATYRKSVEIFKRLQEVSPGDPAALRGQAIGWVSLGRAQALRGDHENAEVSLKTAYEIGRASTGPGAPMTDETLDALQYLGDLAVDRGKPREALAYYSQTLPQIEREATAPGASILDQRALNNTRVRLGQTQVFLGDLDGARQHFQRAIDHARKSAAASPNNAVLRRDVYLYMSRLGTLLAHPDHPNLGERDAAAALLTEAVTLAEKASAADPNDVRARRDLAEMHATLGAVLRDWDPARARAEYERTLEIYRRLPETLTTSPSVSRWIAEHERGLAISLAGMSRLDLAVPRLERAIAEFRRLDAPQPLAVSLTTLARWRLTAGDPRAARAHVDEALASLERTGKEQPHDVSQHKDVAAAYLVMAAIAAKTEGCAQARSWIGRAEALWRALAGTEAAAYAGRQLKTLPGAPACGP